MARWNHFYVLLQVCALDIVFFVAAMLMLQVTISYIDQLDNTAVRQRHLAKFYYFKCQCEACGDAETVSDTHISNRLQRFVIFTYVYNWLNLAS